MNRNASDTDKLADLTARGYCLLGRIVAPQSLSTLEGELATLAAAECAKLGLPGGSLEAALARGGVYRDNLFAQIKNLLAVRAVANEVIAHLQGIGLFQELDLRIPSVHATLKGDLPRDGTFDLPFHQDYRLTRSHRAWRAWIALRDVGPRLGSMEIIPGSHVQRFTHDVADGGYARIDPAQFETGVERVIPELTAGEGLLFNPLLAHRSVTNQGERMKIVLILHIEDAAALYDPDDPDDSIGRFIDISNGR